MKRPLWTTMARMARRARDGSGGDGSGESGASLILALVLVTGASLVIAVVLSFADTSIRVGERLREERAAVAEADGAGQIAINELRHGTYDGTTAQCFSSGGLPAATLTLSNYYQATFAAAADSAVVTCEPDTAHNASSPVAISPANRPTNAVLTLGTAAGEDGLYANVLGAGDLKVHGQVFSNSTVAVAAGSVTTDASLTARGACTGTVNATPAAACSIGAVADPRGVDPNYPAPTAATTLQPVPLCFSNNVIVTFTPGLYTDVALLNLMARCLNTILYFPPGTYYFNFPAATPWVIDSAYVVAGTPTAPLVAGIPPAIPGACRSPVPPNPIGTWTAPGPNTGVQFVFGGASQIVLRNTQAEICGNYSATSPPVALYGLKTAVGAVPAQSGCVVATPYPTTGCAAITAENQAASKLYVQGTAYLPNAALNIALNNPSGQVFSSGVIARTLVLKPTVNANLAGPVIGIPDDRPVGARVVVYLTVYVCPGSGTCTTATGTARIRAKVGILDPTGVAVAGARQITVYSWSLLR
jgi:hypothetical protein